MTDGNAIIRAVERARQAVEALREASRTPRKGAGERVQATRDPAAPLALELFDQAELIHYSLQGWARIVEEEQGDPLPPDQTDAMALYLRQHTGWISAQPWADEMVLELRDHVHTAEGMLGLLPRRMAIPTPCHCGAARWGYPGEGQGGMLVECSEGHAVSLADAAGGPALVSIRGAQRALGIRRATITQAVADEAICNHGTATRPLVDTQEIAAYLRERLGNRNL